jgi:hypothetical protein
MTEPRPPISDEVLAERFPRQHDVRWTIPRNVWAILLSWGLAVVLLSGLFAWKLHLDQQAAAERDRQQDLAMCQMIDRIIGDVEPPAGPDGQRAREIRTDMIAYRRTLACPPRPA